MIYDLVPDTDPILSQPTQRFDFDNPPMDPTELYEILRDTMIANKGIGLAAPQIGLPYSVFVIGNPMDANSIFSVFNPKVVDEKGEAKIEEGCLSFPGLFMKVKRAESIRARFSGHDGKVDSMVMNGFTARAFLHEYDHLQGITFVKKVSKLQLTRAKEQKKKLDRKRKQNVG